MLGSTSIPFPNVKYPEPNPDLVLDLFMNRGSQMLRYT